MLLTRSCGTVDFVRASGTRPPAGRSCFDLPGSHVTKYSPISDWGRDSHVASVCSFWLPSIRTVTSAVR